MSAITISHSSSHYSITAHDTYKFPAVRMGLSCNHLLLVFLLKWSGIVQTKNIVQSTYTSVTKWSLLKWNGR